MKTIKAHNKSVVIILSKKEAIAVYDRLTGNYWGVMKSKILLSAEIKIKNAIDKEMLSKDKYLNSQKYPEII
jgi:hypothetical protein